MSSKKEEGTFEKTRKNVGSYALNHFESNRIISDQNGSDLNIVYISSINPKCVLPETGEIS